MIKLLITDLDGCISEPFKAPDWELLTQIRRLNKQSKNDIAVPPLTICSGRPMPYVEAVAQWLNIDKPVVFESAGIYNLADNNVQFAPVFDDKAEKQVSELKNWLQKEVVDHHPKMVLEFTKKMDAGLIHPETQIINELYPEIVNFVHESYPQFEVHKTDVSVNIILAANNKRAGIQKLCELLALDPSEVAYIGDSSGDIPALKIVGKPFAPENAHPSVKEHAEVVPAKVTEAVLIAYRNIVKQNKNVLTAAE